VVAHCLISLGLNGGSLRTIHCWLLNTSSTTYSQLLKVFSDLLGQSGPVTSITKCFSDSPLFRDQQSHLFDIFSDQQLDVIFICTTHYRLL
jgi:hypothetical protein